MPQKSNTVSMEDRKKLLKCILAEQALRIWAGHTLISAGLNFWVLLPN
jgi:hypothetical protein